MKYDFITQERPQYPVHLLCRVLAVSRSGYYRHLSRPSEGKRASANRELVAEIREIVTTHKRRYGSPRVTAELKRRRRRCSRNRVARLMHSYDLLARQKKRYRITTLNVIAPTAVTFRHPIFLPSSFEPMRRTRNG